MIANLQGFIMSLLSSFLINHFVPALEAAFINHEPAAQEALLAEVKVFSEQVATWLSTKLTPPTPPK